MIRVPSGVQEVGKCNHRTAVTVTSTAQEITLTDGYNSIEIIPAPDATNEVYYGGTGVTSTNGAPMLSGKIWNNCKNGFSVYLVCAAGQTAEVRIVEYEGGE